MILTEVSAGALRAELFVLLLDELHTKARQRYGYTWVYMIKVFIARAYPAVDPVLITQLALMACEQVRKMAEVAYDVPMEERYANR